MWLAATNGFSLGSGLGTHCNRKRRLNAAVLRARLLLSPHSSHLESAPGVSGSTASRHQRNTWGMLVRRAMRSTSRGRLPSILVSLVLATMQTTCSPPEKHQKVRHTKRQYRLQQQSSSAI